MTPPRLHSTSFDWFCWTGGSLTTIGVQHNTVDITYRRRLVRRHAVGYLEAELLRCRPKPDHMAVMFQVDERRFWTHLTIEEFRICFPEVSL